MRQWVKANRCRRFRISASFLLARRQRSGAGKFFEQLNSFGVAGNLLDHLRLLVRHQRCGLIATGEFTILIDECGRRGLAPGRRGLA